MRRVAIMLAGLALSVVPAYADDAACIERFKTLLVDGNPGKGPAKAHITQSFGTMNTENNFYSLGAGSTDGMMEPVKGMGDQQVLFRKGKMYVSTDKGKSWTFVREMDKGSSPEAVKDKLKADADTAKDVSCGTEALDGVDHETVEGTYVASTAQGATITAKYWVNPETGWMRKAVTTGMMGGTQSMTTQMIEPMPDLTLPDPE
ncbi:MAG: hypothetical protein R3287_15195 [Anderseniella sp.]|nr:hypothetical protein [Anderseniella sp.]